MYINVRAITHSLYDKAVQNDYTMYHHLIEYVNDVIIGRYIAPMQILWNMEYCAVHFSCILHDISYKCTIIVVLHISVVQMSLTIVFKINIVLK